ncbi:hypothetical protein C4578_02325 [Candidatus Microgenomates bacterium]|nr:MAG: hypothetical protein C4578_02325 [Candidatus Microgenomates bacterium]
MTSACKGEEDMKRLVLVLLIVGTVFLGVSLVNIVVGLVLVDFFAIFEPWVWILLVVGVLLFVLSIILNVRGRKEEVASTTDEKIEEGQRRKNELYGEVLELQKTVAELTSVVGEKRVQLEQARNEIKKLNEKREELIEELERLNFRAAEMKEERQTPENPLDPPGSELDIPGFLRRHQRD